MWEGNSTLKFYNVSLDKEKYAIVLEVLGKLASSGWIIGDFSFSMRLPDAKN